jgi:molybdate transport system substrate-binding protein
MKMKNNARILFLCLLIVLSMLLGACAPSAPSATEAPVAPAAPVDTEAPAATEAPTAEPVTLVVFAAASLTDAYAEIASAFQAANPGVTVSYNFAGSQTLLTQVQEGAEADVFAPASKKQMDVLVGSGAVTVESKIQVKNKLTVVVSSSAANLTKLEDLAAAGVKVVLAAKEVPAGDYALKTLDSLNAVYGADFSAKVLANTVSYENSVKAVTAKVQLGEADAAIVYVTDASAAQLNTIMIPDENNQIASYPIAVLGASKNAEMAQKFVDFILSAEGQTILAKWGFLPGE